MENSLQKAKNIHCIGIQGTGLSALAGLLAERGKNVTGSDKNGPPHREENIHPNIDLVIYSAAVPETNPERQAASRLGIAQISYPEAVGILTRMYRTIAVCGTHGKTTTTAMLATVLQEALDPSVLVGSTVPGLKNKNYRSGEGEYLIIEACEYQRHFLHYSPSTVVITNIEIDHLDYFEGENDYFDAFRSFLLKIKEKGSVIANEDDKNVRQICDQILEKRPDLTFRWYGKKNKGWNNLKLSVSGEHNRYNGMAALMAAKQVSSLSTAEIIDLLSKFKGTGRRFEQIFSSKGTVVIDDYAHHPTAIRATLRTAREKFGPDKKILCVFQPHQYSRTIKLLKQFAESFQLADEVIIPDIFQVRDSEEAMQQITPEKFVEEIRKHHQKAYYGNGLEKTFYDIQNRMHDFDVILIMGAGDIASLSDRIKSSSK